MNKRIKGTLIFCSCAALLCGYTQSNIVTPSGGFVEGNVAPDFSPKGEIQIDWGELTENLRDEFIQPYGTYGDYVMDLAVYWDDDENALMVLLPVLAKTPSDVAVSYAQDVLKACGNETAVQDFSYEPASFPDEELYYGSYFDSHDAIIRVFPFDSEDDESTYIVNDTMKAGEQRPVTALK